MERIYLLLIMRQLELNDNTNKYMVITGDQNAGRSYSKRIDNGSFELAEQFKYLGITLTNRNSLQEEIICGFIIKKTSSFKHVA